ncbi:hypothetical protein B0H67DRAFT_345421 [Lasiosphaeris hirsuta]|uniref:Uncharacterized protein n=1 Tax=Lasiosphaeris hirsuta TaxID=260670 RepID=A0AA40A3L5_9PEZI|nr:hypothetical protein B0H67DRAFT_345421 [Lasiosphaeris hirsuta]
MPLHCTRCRTMMDTAADLGAHMRVSKDDICNLNTETPIEGFTPDQGQAMRSRKSGRGLSEVEKWKGLYLILFPECNPDETPEPYHTDNSSTDDLLQYERYLEQETEQHVRARMKTNPIPCIRNLTESVRHELLQQIPQLVRDIQLDLFRSYKTSHQNNPQELTNHRPPPATETQPHEPTQPPPTQEPQGDLLGDASPSYEPICSAACLEPPHCRYLDAGLGSEWMGDSLLNDFDFAETVAETAFAEAAGFEFLSLLSGHRETGSGVWEEASLNERSCN